MKLRLPEFRQLRQRITLRAKTHPLTLEETHEYVATRLRIAGSDGRQIFAPDAIDSVHHYSEGIPRVINILCEDSLVGAFVGHQPVIPKKIVEQMARELELDIYPADRSATFRTTSGRHHQALGSERRRQTGTCKSAIVANHRVPADPARAPPPPRRPPRRSHLLRTRQLWRSRPGRPPSRAVWNGRAPSPRATWVGPRRPPSVHALHPLPPPHPSGSILLRRRPQRTTKSCKHCEAKISHRNRRHPPPWSRLLNPRSKPEPKLLPSR